ncbi:glycosyl transferase [Halobacteriales archaeon QS_1_68_20]|nr:MAG: glycosyl transferase [Halobacteriales archaeon QS_1_68_20]
MSSRVEVSVVLPAYDEADTLERTVEVTLDTLGEFLPEGSYEVIVAEDGCTDRTPEIAARMAEADDRVGHVHSDERLGRGGALEEAFSRARGDTIAYFDTDLATDMRHLEELIESVRSGEYDVVTGSRWIPGHEADRPPKRGIPSRVYNGLVRLFLRSNLKDHQCGFKAFDRAVLDDLLSDVEDDHWFWDTELLVRAQRAGYSVREFPVDWTPQGDTKVDLVRDVFGMGSQILRTWWQLSVSPRVNRRRSIAAGILLVAVAVVLMVGDVPPVWEGYLPVDEVLDRLSNADARLVAAATVLYVLSWPLRGWRYQDILSELGYREDAGFLTGAVFISQTGNLVFPARAGDAIRAYVVKTRRAVPYPTGFASLAAERVYDLLTITGLAGAVFLGLAASGRASGLFDAVLTANRSSGRTGVIVALGIGAAAIFAVLAIVATARSDRNYVRAVVTRLSNDSYADYVAGVVERFAGDVQRIAADRGTFARVGLTSVAIWTIDVLVAVLVFAAFEGVTEATGPVMVLAVGFFAVSVGNLAKVLPLSPGGVGLYEGAFSLLVVALLPVGWGTALGAAIVDHAIKNAVTVGGGVVSMLWLNVSLTTAVEETRNLDEAEVGSD